MATSVKSLLSICLLAALPMSIAGLAVLIAGLSLLYKVMTDNIGRKDFIKQSLFDFLRFFIRLFTGQQELKKLILAENAIAREERQLTAKTVLAAAESIKEVDKKVSEIRTNQAISLSTNDAFRFVSPEPMFKTDMNSHIIWFNQAFADFLECDNEHKLMGFAWIENIIPTDSIEDAYKTVDRFIKNPFTYAADFEYQTCKTKKKVKAWVTTQFITDEKKNPVGTVGSLKIKK